jgi:hypothetical protein
VKLEHEELVHPRPFLALLLGESIKILPLVVAPSFLQSLIKSEPALGIA